MSKRFLFDFPILRKVQLVSRFVYKTLFERMFYAKVIIEGDLSAVRLGVGTVVEPGAVLSTTYGGTITLGQGCVVRRGAMIMTYGGDIVLGDHCIVGPYTILYGHGGLRAGDYVLFAAHSIVIPANHTFGSLDRPIYEQPVSKQGIDIGSDVWIGAGVKILDGVQIGDGAVIGAGSVVTENLLPLSVNVGVPSRLVRMRTWSTDGSDDCSESGH